MSVEFLFNKISVSSARQFIESSGHWNKLQTDTTLNMKDQLSLNKHEGLSVCKVM